MLAGASLLNDRGMLGDGATEITKLRGLVEACGYQSPVEIFSRCLSGALFN
jgi:hypothetical protein